MARPKGKRRKPWARTVVLMPAPKTNVTTIRRLTSEILGLAQHLVSHPAYAHDRQSLKALECKRHRRGELLEALRQQDRNVYEQLVTELQTGENPGERKES